MQLSDALDYAQKFLAKSERTEIELQYELSKRGCAPELIKDVLAKAKDYNWVCDERYCLRFCERQLCKGYGPINIIETLRDKGLKKSAIVKVVSEIDHSTWEHAAMLALEKKFGRAYKSEVRVKVINYLESRGFNDEHMMFLIRED